MYITNRMYRQLMQNQKKVIADIEAIPHHQPPALPPGDAADLATIASLYNQAIHTEFAALDAQHSAYLRNDAPAVIEHGTRAELARREAVRIDGLRTEILHQAKYFKP